MKNHAFAAVLAVVAVLVLGCSYNPKWPERPDKLIGTPAAPQEVEFTLHHPAEEQYRESCRDGVKRVLYFADGEGKVQQVTDLDKLDMTKIHHVFILLDGVAYDMFNELYQEGHFRLFYPPGQMAAPFPSLTDISYSGIFRVAGASCYECVVYNPKDNKLEKPLDVYLSGNNELWSSKLDYRQRLWLDAISYTIPSWACRREFHAMFGKAEEVLADCPEQQNVLIYSISTDAAGHMIGWQRTREVLIELDRYLERLMHDRKGQLGMVMLADHGNNFMPHCRCVDIEGALKAAGLNPVTTHGFEKPHDVVLPDYGLISLARAYCRSEQDRRKIIEAWLATPGVEHVMWFKDGTACIARNPKSGPVGTEVGGTAEIHRRVADGGEYFSYVPRKGDPLELLPILAKLSSRQFEGSDEKFYESHELLRATINHNWPDPLYRVWHGLTDNSAVVPDVAASLGYGYYYGSTTLHVFAGLEGTHGGLARKDTNTFFTTTMFAPPAILRTADVPDLINQHFLWNPPTDNPQTKGLQPYLHREKPLGPGMRHLE